jgi:hypothetical protein
MLRIYALLTSRRNSSPSAWLKRRYTKAPTTAAATKMTHRTRIFDRLTSRVSDLAKLKDESLVDSAPAVRPVPSVLLEAERLVDASSDEETSGCSVLMVGVLVCVGFVRVVDVCEKVVQLQNYESEFINNFFDLLLEQT